MDSIKLEFPDGNIKEYKKDISGLEVARSIGEGLAQAAIAVKLNDEIYDLSTPLTTSGTFTILTFRDDEGKEVFRHSASHVMAIAVKRVFPDAKLTIGPSVEDGFYYDFDTDAPFTPEDLAKIESAMKKVVKEKIPFKRIDCTPKEAKEKQKDNPYKLEMIDDLGDEKISLYENEDFVDLCRGPHVPHTGKIKAFKLTKIAGAYWRGNAKNKQLQRVYGVAFPDKKQLKEYLHRIEEAEKRDHRKLGKNLELFSMHDEGQGFPFFLPKGMVLKNQLIDYWRKEHRKEGYVEIQTPIILSKELWKTSGHWENYRDNMYTTQIDGQDYAIKPMNCPGGMITYKEKIHSYKEFPLRVGELGIVHRHELSGVLSGLFRVRVFTQDDAHIFMTPEQIKDEILRLMKFIDRIYSLFGFEYEIELSTRPDKSIGSDEQWDMATNGLKDALEASGRKYTINEGDGAFYGPKIDFHIKDALKRTWQCGTIQLDMSLPERFDLTYEGQDGKKHRPVMIHRVIYGSLERFIGILIEHYGGRFPLWLSPVQAKIIGITDNHTEYVEKIQSDLEAKGIRTEIDTRTETVNYKIRDAQLQQINYILVVGDKELENKTVNVRKRDGSVIGEQSTEKLIESLQKEINEKI